MHKLKLKKNFGADELVPILIYVVVKSRVRELGIYLKVRVNWSYFEIIENFTPRNALNSSSGYKLVTLQSCFFIISTWDEKVDERRKNQWSRTMANKLDAPRIGTKSNSFAV
jgi:hypothetical protein